MTVSQPTTTRQATSKKLSLFDTCIHCGDSERYCSACFEWTKNPDYCAQCSPPGASGGDHSYVPLQKLPKSGGTGYYRCQVGHVWTCNWGI